MILPYATVKRYATLGTDFSMQKSASIKLAVIDRHLLPLTCQQFHDLSSTNPSVLDASLCMSLRSLYLKNSTGFVPSLSQVSLVYINLSDAVAHISGDKSSQGTNRHLFLLGGMYL